MKKDNLKGKCFGRLVVKECAGKDKWGNIKWLCGCDCGNEKIINGSSLKTGDTKSCGCIKIEKNKKISFKTWSFYKWKRIKNP